VAEPVDPLRRSDHPEFLSAVTQFRALIEDLAAGADELAIGGRVDGGRCEGGHPVAVLEGEDDAEVPFERAADRGAGQGAQELAAGLLAGWGHLVLPERCVGVLGVVVDGGADDVPGVGKRVADDGNEPRVIEFAVLCCGQYVRGNVERHKTS
jgi:hypothetical protein